MVWLWEGYLPVLLGSDWEQCVCMCAHWFNLFVYTSLEYSWHFLHTSQAQRWERTIDTVEQQLIEQRLRTKMQGGNRRWRLSGEQARGGTMGKRRGREKKDGMEALTVYFTLAIASLIKISSVPLIKSLGNFALLFFKWSVYPPSVRYGPV